jgi:hypothetical protein
MTETRIADALWPDGFGRDCKPADEGNGETGAWLIDKDIPIPPPRSGIPHFIRYPFASMEVGDSHLELVGDDYAPDVRSRLCSAAYAFRHRRPEHSTWVFSTRTSDQGVRIWRVK